jgi:hypothetical protein
MRKVSLYEEFINEKREDVGKYNTVKKVIAKIGRRPSEQELATFINNNYYDVTEVERGEDDPAANDKIADLVAFYKFDIDDWQIAWADAQNESVVNEAEKYITDKFKVGDKIKTNFGEWEVIETDYAPKKSFIGSFIFKGKDMERVNIPNPPKTNKNAVGYKVTDGAKYPTIGFLYQYKDITKLATVDVDESVVTEALASSSKIEKNLNKALKANINMFGDNNETIKVLDTPVRIERSQYDKEMNGRSKNFGASIMYMYGSRTNEYNTAAVIGVISRTKGTAKVFLYSEETYSKFAEGASFKEYEGASVLAEFQNKTRDVVSHLSKFPADGSANESIVTEANDMSAKKLSKYAGFKEVEYEGAVYAFKSKELGKMQFQAEPSFTTIDGNFRDDELNIEVDRRMANTTHAKVLGQIRGYKNIIAFLKGGGAEKYESGNLKEIEMYLKKFDFKSISESVVNESKKSEALADAISKSIMKIDDSMSYADFALAVGQILRDDYGQHNFMPFMKVLHNDLGIK